MPLLRHCRFSSDSAWSNATRLAPARSQPAVVELDPPPARSPHREERKETHQRGQPGHPELHLHVDVVFFVRLRRGGRRRRPAALDRVGIPFLAALLFEQFLERQGPLLRVRIRDEPVVQRPAGESQGRQPDDQKPQVKPRITFRPDRHGSVPRRRKCKWMPHHSIVMRTARIRQPDRFRPQPDKNR